MKDLITILTATQSVASVVFEILLGALGSYLIVLKIRRARRLNDEGKADSDRSQRPGPN
jgi:hypothetical protein